MSLIVGVALALLAVLAVVWLVKTVFKVAIRVGAVLLILVVAAAVVGVLDGAGAMDFLSGAGEWATERGRAAVGWAAEALGR